MAVADLLALPQVSPAGWGAKINYDSWTQRSTNQAFLHWGGTRVSSSAAQGVVDGEKATLRGWENYHVNTRKYRGIAYDWAIGNSGTLYRCRGGSMSAATGGDIDRDGRSNNSEGEAIVFIIGEGQKPSAKALATAAKVLHALNYAENYGHQESAQRGTGTATSCPGPDVMQFVRDYRAGKYNEIVKETKFMKLFYGKRGTPDAHVAAAAADLIGASYTVSQKVAADHMASGGELYVVGGPAGREFGKDSVGTHVDENLVVFYGDTGLNSAHRLFQFLSA